VPRSNIFISHASADRSLADLFKNTLVLGGVAPSAIFYSSARGTGVPVGEDFRRHLRNKLRESELVIQLISKTFLRRPMCLYEVGAAWVLDLPTYPIVIPPLSRGEVSQYLGDTHTALLANESDIDDLFSELSDQIRDKFELPLKASDWSDAVKNFKALLPTSMPTVVDDEAQLPVDRATSTTVIERADQIDGQTLQEHLSPFLHTIMTRQNKASIYVRVPDQPVWLGFGTMPHRQFGEDYNTIAIYFSNPTTNERRPLDTFVNWTAGRTLNQVIDAVRRHIHDNPDRRMYAKFDAEPIIAELKAQIKYLAE
jgi:hypothetical protein